MSTDYGKFYNFCQDSTLPVCNLFPQSLIRDGPLAPGFAHGFMPGSCILYGIPLGGGRYLRNLGVVILCGIAVLTTLYLLWRAEKKPAAVGRREMQLFFLGYLLLQICELFSVGGFPLNATVRIAFSAIHIGLVIALSWILMLNGAVSYKLMEDGTILSLVAIFGSAAAIFIGTAYIALDTGFSWTGYWNSTLVYPDRAYALYTLYLLCPIVFLFIYFVSETIVVLISLREIMPMLPLVAAALFFIVGQIFDFIISVHICRGTGGKIDGSMFETFFTLLAVIMIYFFWDSITEDDWPQSEPQLLDTSA